MKKLTAWLVALMLLWLPVTSLAEGATQTRLSLQTSAVRLQPILQSLTGSEDSNLATGLAKLLNGLQVSLIQQDGAWELSLYLQEEEILSGMMVNYSDTQDAFCCSLLPGYAMVGPTLSTAEDPQADEAMVNAIAEQINTLTFTEETGTFADDAYTGGVRRLTTQLDDRKLSEMLWTVLDDPNSAWQTLLHNAARANTYQYQLSLVYDAQDALVGISGIAMQGDAQIATLSIGETEEELTIVWGYGTGGVNYYISLRVAVQDVDGVTGLSVIAEAYEDAQGLGFKAVSSESMLGTSLLETDMFALVLTPNDDGDIWEGVVQLMQHENQTMQSISFSGQQGEMTAGLYWNGSEEPALLLSATTQPCDALQTDVSGLTLLDVERMSQSEADQANAVFNEAWTPWLLKLFKLMPAELVLMLIRQP